MTRFTGTITSITNGLEEAFLPNLYVTSHAANLLELASGDLLCIWFSGSGEGNPDTNIVMSRMNVGIKRWQPPVELSNDAQRSEQNTVLFLAQDD